jgi:hypothetical protein
MKNLSAMKNTRTNSAKKESNYKTQKDSTAIYTESGSLTKYGRSLERKAQQTNFTAWEFKEVSHSEKKSYAN